jgi:hypothetical protein
MSNYINLNILNQFEHKNIALAIDKELKFIDGCISYDKTNKEPICSLINSMYWNGSNTGKTFYNGKEITKKYNFIFVNDSNLKEIKRLVKNIHFWLNNLDKKNAGVNASFYEDKLFKHSGEYKKEI